MSQVKTLAIVLKSIDWKDTSKIVTLFTRENGKMNVIAKGARRSNSRYRGVLESINLIEIIVYLSVNRQLQMLGQATLEDGFQKIKSDFDKTGYIFALLEITDIFFQQGSGDPIYFDFLKTLMYEMVEIENPKIIFWYFLLKLSSYLGFRPEFKICKKCAKEVGLGEVVFSVRDGAVICNNCSASVGDGWKLPQSVRNFLFGLQKSNHKHLSDISFTIDYSFPYTDFLIIYLRYHSEEKLELSTLKLFK